MSEEYGLSLVSAPAAEPLTATEVKAHCRVEITDDDTLIESQITAARQLVEKFLRRRLVTQTWDLFLDRFPSEIRVPYPPLVSVSSISYVDTSGSTQTLSSTLYTVDAYREPGRIRPAYGQTWPATRCHVNDVTVRYVAGFGAASAVPKAIKQAMLLILEHWYENRGQVVVGSIVNEVPIGAEDLLWAHRMVEF